MLGVLPVYIAFLSIEPASVSDGCDHLLQPPTTQMCPNCSGAGKCKIMDSVAKFKGYYVKIILLSIYWNSCHCNLCSLYCFRRYSLLKQEGTKCHPNYFLSCFLATFVAIL